MITVSTQNARACLIAVLTATCLATNYALAGLPNIKVMDFIVFVGGFCFGAFAGCLIGILTWVIYGMINPYGFVFQVWLGTMFSEAIYGVIGGLLGKNLASTNFNDHHLRLSVLFGTVGFILTLIYDLITNVVYAPVFGVPIIVAIIFGMPFTVLHECSNAIIFGVGSVPIVTRLEKFLGGDRFGVSKK